MRIFLPIGYHLNIDIHYILLATLFALLSLYLALPGPLKPENKQVFHPSNLPARVLAETTVAPFGEKVAGGKAEAKVAREFTVVGGETYRLPLKSEEYVVEVRQVVETAKGGGM
ncbi:MAG: hypothetical protein Q9224_007360 [Gallowayella concinna]